MTCADRDCGAQGVLAPFVAPAPPWRAIPALPDAQPCVRYDTTTLLAAVDTAPGHLIGSLHRRHRCEVSPRSSGRSARPCPIISMSISCSTSTRPTRPSPQALAPAPPNLPPPLHPVMQRLEEPRAALVRRVHEEEDAALLPKEVQRLECHSCQWLEISKLNPRPYMWVKPQMKSGAGWQASACKLPTQNTRSCGT